jgi:hypothetical protein
VKVNRGETGRPPVPVQAQAPGSGAAFSPDTQSRRDTIRQDTAAASVEPKKKRAAPRAARDSSGARSQARGDSALPAPGSDGAADTAAKKAAGGCESDTATPWVYTDPSGGLHHEALSVRLFSTKPCSIEWKTGGDGPWKSYGGESIPIEKTTTILLRARDSCGRAMEERGEHYELAPADTSRLCPADMEHVLVGATSFCIDRYEWPNVKGRLPRTYVSVFQAMDTCASAGKRLCTADEWTIACTGPYGWKYPYGAAFERFACQTHDTAVRPSGSRSECRGYFGIFDMSGNCAEWTSTRSGANPRFFDVMGGFWESGPQSGCFDVRYSYFPQNRHNPVGFRCCRDAQPPASPQRGAR